LSGVFTIKEHLVHTWTELILPRRLIL